MFQAVVACPEPEYGYLLPTGQQVVWVGIIVAWVLVFPLCLLLSLDDSLGFRVGGRPVRLFLCTAFLCQRVSSLIAKNIAVGGNPLQNLMKSLVLFLL